MLLRTLLCRCALLAAWYLLSAAAARGEDWTAWRGPRADGTSAEKNLPVKWSATENVRWKTPLPGPGNSTPIVLGSRIFLTQATDGGAKRGVMCFDRDTGKELWSRWIDYSGQEPTHKDNPYCSASPATDGQAVYAWHGSAGAVAYDLGGNTLWQRDLGKFNHIWGNAASPVVYKDLLILHCGPGERAFVVALNKKNGETVWEFPSVPGKADQFLGSWSSPKLVQHDGRDLLLICRPKSLVALDPNTAEEVWSCDGLTDLVYTTPLVGDGVVVAMSGYTGKALAVRLGGKGNVTSEGRLWITPDDRKEQQRIGSGIIREGRIYMINEPGVLERIDLATGESPTKERVCGTTWSSPVLADGKFYILDQTGTTHVFTTEPKLEVLARNALGEHCNSSHAISGGNIFMRTDKNLWCVGGNDK